MSNNAFGWLAQAALWALIAKLTPNAVDHVIYLVKGGRYEHPGNND